MKFGAGGRCHGFLVLTRVSDARAWTEVERDAALDIGRWWSSEHTWSGKASNLGLVAEAGIAVFKVAFENWLTDPADRSLAEHIRETLSELRAATRS